MASSVPFYVHLLLISIVSIATITADGSPPLGSSVIVKCPGIDGANVEWKFTVYNSQNKDINNYTIRKCKADGQTDGCADPGLITEERVYVLPSGKLMVSYVTEEDLSRTSPPYSCCTSNRVRCDNKVPLNIDDSDIDKVRNECSGNGKQVKTPQKWPRHVCKCDISHSGPHCEKDYNNDRWVLALVWIVVLLLPAGMFILEWRFCNKTLLKADDPIWRRPLWLVVNQPDQAPLTEEDIKSWFDPTQRSELARRANYADDDKTQTSNIESPGTSASAK